jgi:NAD-dependent oxidoreductase involved in siderophore biosynthesis
LSNPAPVHYLDYILNNRSTRVPSFVGIATSGQGVFATLNAISRLLLQKFARENEAAAKHQSQPQTSSAPATTALSGIAAAAARR